MSDNGSKYSNFSTQLVIEGEIDDEIFSFAMVFYFLLYYMSLLLIFFVWSCQPQKT